MRGLGRAKRAVFIVGVCLTVALAPVQPAAASHTECVPPPPSDPELPPLCEVVVLLDDVQHGVLEVIEDTVCDIDPSCP